MSSSHFSCSLSYYHHPNFNVSLTTARPPQNKPEAKPAGLWAGLGQTAFSFISMYKTWIKNLFEAIRIDLGEVLAAQINFLAPAVSLCSCWFSSLTAYLTSHFCSFCCWILECHPEVELTTGVFWDKQGTLMFWFMARCAGVKERGASAAPLDVCPNMELCAASSPPNVGAPWCRAAGSYLWFVK